MIGKLTSPVCVALWMLVATATAEAQSGGSEPGCEGGIAAPPKLSAETKRFDDGLGNLLKRLFDGADRPRPPDDPDLKKIYEKALADLEHTREFVRKLDRARLCGDTEEVARLEATDDPLLKGLVIRFQDPAPAAEDEDDVPDGEFGDGDIVLGPEGSDDRDGVMPPEGLVGPKTAPPAADEDDDVPDGEFGDGDIVLGPEGSEGRDGVMPPEGLVEPQTAQPVEIEPVEIEPIAPEVASPEELAALLPGGSGAFDIIQSAGADANLTACRAAAPAFYCQNFTGRAQADCADRMTAEQSFCATGVRTAANSCEATCARVASELQISEYLLNAARKAVTDNYTAVERNLSLYPEFVHIRPTLDAWRERALQWWTWGTSPLLDAGLRCEGDAISRYLDQCLTACRNSEARVSLTCRAMGQTATALPTARVHLDPPGSLPGKIKQ